MYRSPSSALTALAIVAAFTVSSASAGIVFVGDSGNLGDLIDTNGELTVDGLKFSNFEYDTNPEGSEPDADLIEVRGILNDDGYYGIEFQGNFNEVSGGLTEFAINFDVMVLADQALITDVHVFGVLRASEDGENGDVPEGSIEVVTDSLVLIDSIFIGDNGDDPSVNEDWEFTDGEQSNVPIDIDLGINNGFLSILQVTFSRGDEPGGTPEIPAPAALPAGLALALFAATRRRRM